MKNFLSATIIFLCPLFAFSQANFREGYIVTIAGDSIFGLIDYREGFKPYHTCTFKSRSSSNAISYTPDQVHSYGFPGDKVFESRHIRLTAEPEKTVFLELLVDGIVSLYKFEKSFWIEKEDHQLLQLTNETEEAYVNGVKVVKSTNHHIGTLNSLMFDCPDLRNRIYRIRLVEKDLTKLVDDYHKCKGKPAITYKATKKWITAAMGITAGFNVSIIRFKTDLPGYDHLLRSFDLAMSPAIGLSLDVKAPRSSERFSLSLSPSYMPMSYKYSRSDPNFNASQVTTSVNIDLKQFHVPVGIRYTFPERKIAPHFNAGLSYTLHLNSRSNWTENVITNDNNVQTTSREAVTIRDHQLGIWGGVGISKSIENKLNGSIELRCEQTNGIVPFDVDSYALRGTVTNFRVIFGIKFK